MWLPSYATPSERLMRIMVVVFAVAVLIFLIAPLFIIVPLSFSKDPFFTLPVREYSLRWYADLFGVGVCPYGAGHAVRGDHDDGHPVHL